MMRDLSFFLLKNSLAAKMRKGIRTFCNGVGSTSTLEQRKSERDVSCMAAPSLAGSSYADDGIPAGAAAAAARSPLTLEQMILQLDMEEAAARRARLEEEEDDCYYGELHHRRMSCINSSDILRSARNALSQYPRFSLDGRDAMYRSSFLSVGEKARRSGAGRKSAAEGCNYKGELGMALQGLPPTVAGESVVWCKPGVVAKLMGLEAVPVPLGVRRRRVGAAIAGRKQSLRRMGRHELERERVAMGVDGKCCRGARRGESAGSCCSAGGGSRAVQPGYGRPATGRPEWRFARAR